MSDGGGDRGRIALQVSSLELVVTEEMVIYGSLLSITRMDRTREMLHGRRVYHQWCSRRVPWT